MISRAKLTAERSPISPQALSVSLSPARLALYRDGPLRFGRASARVEFARAARRNVCRVRVQLVRLFWSRLRWNFRRRMMQRLASSGSRGDRRIVDSLGRFGSSSANRHPRRFLVNRGKAERTWSSAAIRDSLDPRDSPAGISNQCVYIVNRVGSARSANFT